MRIKVALLVIGLLSAVSPTQTQPRAAPATDDEKAYNIGVQAYVYAYPLVLMDLTRQVRRTPMNKFFHLPSFPTPESKTIVRPNVDTLYSTAWLDLSHEPIVLSVPDTSGRYYVMQLLDAWTETFALPGIRTTGSKAGNFAVVGPDWNGKLPKSVKGIKAPTNTVWLLGRTQTNGIIDISKVRMIQDEFKLTPLADWVQSKPAVEECCYRAPAKVDMKTPPPVQVARMDAVTFFKAFASVLKGVPPHPEDAPLIKDMKAIGIERGMDFDISKLSPDASRALDRAVKDAQKMIADRARESGTLRNGWRFASKNIGRYGTAYLDRAAVALFGLGALPPEEAIYPTTYVDDEGKQLNGAGRYTLHFDKDQLPPVSAFWSVTMYGPDGYLIDNPLNRYGLGDRDKLRYNEDGSLDVYIQRASPGADKESNWLPAPGGDFNVTLRLYLPKPAASSGKWLPRAVTRVRPSDKSD